MRQPLNQFETKPKKFYLDYFLIYFHFAEKNHTTYYVIFS